MHLLRTDGGGEYKSIDLICRDFRVSNQITEDGNQAGNEKTERMHRKVVDMIRCVIFSYDLPLSFWSYAAKYLAYVLNCMLTRAYPRKASPIATLTGRPSSFVDIVVFGSPCETNRDP